MKIYLPQIFGNAQAKEFGNLNREELDLLRLVTTDVRQQRARVSLHPILCKVARARATDFGRRGFDHHTDRDGYSANWHVSQAGYVLPQWWGDKADANYIESLTAGNPTAQDAWISWTGHAGHREHVLGMDFWTDQVNVGCGYAYLPDSDYRHYWALITCPPEG